MKNNIMVFYLFLFILIQLTVPESIFCQITMKVDFSQDLIDDVLNNPYIECDFTSELIEYDLSHFWLSDTISSELGIIGSDYQKIQIHINSVSINKTDKKTYSVLGKSKVRDNICDFKGTIKIIKVVKFKGRYGSNLISGDVLAEYIFYENEKQEYSGFFKGNLCTWWHLDTLKKTLFIEDGSRSGDMFQNNTFVGIWKSYQTGDIKKCIWGHNRLPYTDDFDIGIAEMYVNPKYVKNGWETFNSRDRNTWPVRHYDKTKWWEK